MLAYANSCRSFDDAYGHKVGGQVLQQFSSILEYEVRVVDFTVRFGGEGFVIVFPNTNIETVVEVTERIRKAVEIAKFESIGQVITASFGLAQNRGGETEDDVICRADDAMYQSKAGGA